MTTYWVGLENEFHAPHGHGEDYREYVTVDDDSEEGARALQEAVIRIVCHLTNLKDGDRISIRRTQSLE